MAENVHKPAFKPMSPAVEEKKSSPSALDEDAAAPAKPEEIGGPKGLEPTRYGDWERKGRCVDF